MAENFDFLTATVADLTGKLVADTVDNDGIPNKVLQNGIANGIRVHWELTGNLIAFDSLNGSWELQAVLEKIGGGGGEFTLTHPVIPWNHASPAVYDATIDIPAGVPAQTGAYKVVVLLQHLNFANNPTRMAGFVEIPMVRFY